MLQTLVFSFVLTTSCLERQLVTWSCSSACTLSQVSSTSKATAASAKGCQVSHVHVPECQFQTCLSMFSIVVICFKNLNNSAFTLSCNLCQISHFELGAGVSLQMEMSVTAMLFCELQDRNFIWRPTRCSEITAIPSRQMHFIAHSFLRQLHRMASRM